MTSLEKIYLVKEKQLLHLLEIANRYYALECGGVDNWESYGASLGDYLANAAIDIGYTGELNFKTLAQEDIKHYKEDGE